MNLCLRFQLFAFLHTKDLFYLITSHPWTKYCVHKWWICAHVSSHILLDARGDILVYGMGETPVVEIAEKLHAGVPASELNHIRGTVVVRGSIDFLQDSVQIPSYRGNKKRQRQIQWSLPHHLRPAEPLHRKTAGAGARWPLCHPFSPRPCPWRQKREHHLWAALRTGLAPGVCGAGRRAGTWNRALFPGVAPGVLRRVQLLLAHPSPGTDGAEQEQGITGAGGPAAFRAGWLQGNDYRHRRPDCRYAASCSRWQDKGACEKKSCLTPVRL